MEKASRPHPDHEWLLLWSDGELASEARATMKKHLEACWECRHELQQIEQAISGAVEYRRQMRAQMPGTPAPWRDLTAGFEAIDRAMAPPSIWARVGATMRMPRYAIPLGALAVAAAVVAVRESSITPLATVPVKTATQEASVATTGQAVDSGPTTIKPKAATTQRKVEPGKEPGLAELASSTVRVFALLHERGADLGEPIEVRRAGGRVVVRGFGLDAARERELDGALRAIPFVEPRLKETTGATVPASIEHVRLTPGVSPFQADLERILGGGSAADEWMAIALDESESIMLRAHALRRLDGAFGGDSLAGEDAAIVAGIRQTHARAMIAEAAKLRAHLQLLRVAMGGVTLKGPEKAGDYFGAARQLEDSLAGMAGAKSTEPRLDAAVASALAHLAEIESLARALLASR